MALIHEPLGELSGIADWLAGYSGISTGSIGKHSLQRAIQQRLQATGSVDLRTYEDRLLASEDEQQNLVERVVVPETWFFRDRHPYTHLRQHLQQRLQAGRCAQPLRLLSAPCASGEEPYSIAMTLLDLGLPQQAFRIDAIDICRRSIRKARQAVYGPHAFRGVSEAEKQRHFQVTAQGLVPHPAIRATVQFRRANLMTCLAGMAGGYDVIFCRNLLIYLKDSASERLLASLAALLKVGGLLVVGAAESGMVPASLFTPLRDSFMFGFQRRDPEASPAPQAVSKPGSADARREPARGRPPARASRRSTRRSAALGPAAGTASSAALPRPDHPSQPGADPPDLQRCREDVARAPSSDAAHLRLAQCLLRHNRQEEAIVCLRKCLYLRPDRRDAMELLIQLSQQLGQLERSRHYQARLARLDS